MRESEKEKEEKRNEKILEKTAMLSDDEEFI